MDHGTAGAGPDDDEELHCPACFSWRPDVATAPLPGTAGARHPHPLSYMEGLGRAARPDAGALPTLGRWWDPRNAPPAWIPGELAPTAAHLARLIRRRWESREGFEADQRASAPTENDRL